MSERWPGYNDGTPPPGAQIALHKRPARDRHWHMEVTWEGLVYDDGVVDIGWIDLGPVPEYLRSSELELYLLDWASIADDHLPEQE